MTALRLPDADRVARFATVPACVFLFVLPITHTVAIRTIALGLVAFCAGYVWWRERPPPPPRYLLVAMAAWTGIAIASLLWTIDFEYSQGEVRNEVVYPLVAFFSFYALTRGEEQWRVWLRVMVVSAGAIAVYAFANFARHADWYTKAYVGDRNAYSTYATLIAPALLVAMLDRGLGTRWRIVAFVALVLTLGAGALTQNRMMWPALVVAALILLATRFRWRAAGRGGRTAVVVAVLALGAAGGAQIVAVSGQKTLAPGAATLGARLEADPRLRIWDYAVQRVAERPWLGYGYGRGILRKDFDAHFGDELYWHSHNMFLNCALGGGVLLLGALVAMLAALAHALWRGSRDWTDAARAAYALGLAVLAAAIVKSLTDDILIRETSLLLWSLLGMGFGRASAASGRSAQDV